MRTKLTALVLAAAGLVAGCGGPAGERPGVGDASRAQAADLRGEGWTTDFSRHLVPLGQFASGGPGRDGIPPLDAPKTLDLRGGDGYVAAREPVLAVAVRGQARAYPLRILVWHEIANDTLGGTPIAVTYCPLCNSSVVFDRRLAGRTLRLGTTGKLRNSDLVMWDRQTQSWWQQFSGQALVGRLAGARLRPLPSQTLSWSQFKARYPRGTVLSKDTGFDRPYGSNPYRNYDTDPRERPFLYNGRSDPRLPPKERVAAVFGPHGATVVVPFSRLARRPVVSGEIGGQPFVVLYQRGVASALDSDSIPAGRDVGTAAAFDPTVGRRRLSFAATGRQAFADRETGSTWDITGRATAGRLRGARLRPLRHDEQFWFALAAFVPRAKLAG